ncbi:hypothetical protein [Plebeiibacterium marinum]|uniref:Uncharacterized protein n=1 Tax=Plebeiibacterium marinum TaxID=2992111 RepID=A0AAE3MG06_9BACT|nr:hypothetical protein [Plebeiobacterium marinum]MCW3806916.1 hypothetical protein [Plebeiobacterium marinum]
MILEYEYSDKMLSKTVAELYKYVDEKDRFQEGAVLAAARELLKRGETREDLSDVIYEMEVFFLEQKGIVDVEDAEPDVNENNIPVIYHPRFIRIFGVLFSVFAGSILMAMNLSRLHKEKMARQTVLAGLAYSIVQGTIFYKFNIQVTGLTLIVSLIGMNVLEFFIWNKQVPVNMKFRNRNVWVPLLVGVLVLIPLVYYVVSTGGLLQ